MSLTNVLEKHDLLHRLEPFIEASLNAHLVKMFISAANSVLLESSSELIEVRNAVEPAEAELEGAKDAYEAVNAEFLAVNESGGNVEVTARRRAVGIVLAEAEQRRQVAINRVAEIEAHREILTRLVNDLADVRPPTEAEVKASIAGWYQDQIKWPTRRRPQNPNNVQPTEAVPFQPAAVGGIR